MICFVSVWAGPFLIIPCMLSTQLLQSLMLQSVGAVFMALKFQIFHEWPAHDGWECVHFGKAFLLPVYDVIV